MKKLGIFSLLFLMIMSPLFAEPKLGGRLGWVGLGRVSYGDDLNDVFDDGDQYTLGANIPVHTHIDLRMEYNRINTDGEFAGFDVEAESDVFSLKPIYHFKPGEKINPFLGAGIVYEDGELSVDTPDGEANTDDDDTGFTLNLGAEWIINDQLSLQGEVEYLDIFDDDDTNFGIEARYDLGGGVSIRGSLSHAFDSANTIGDFGVLFDF